MPRRRVHAGIILVGFVIASGLAMACLIFAALSVGGHHVNAADASASQTSAPSAETTTPTASHTAKTTGPKSPAAKPGTTIAPLPPLAAASSATATPTSTPAPTSSRGANQRDTADPVSAGDCVAGVGSDGSVTKTSCGSSNSAYRVNSKAGSGGQCPSDSDRSVSQTLPGGAKDTLCLDTDWEVGRCMAVSGNSATPTDCTAGPGTMRVQAINRNTADVNTCTDANHGVVYKQRKFVVCLAQM